MDREIFFALYGGDGGGALTWVMMALTVIGSGWAAFAVVPFLGFGRTRLLAGALALVMLADTGAVALLKTLFARERPWLAFRLTPYFDMPTNFSFPSGHATGAFSVAVFLAVALGSVRGRAWIVGGLVALAAAIALSRVYLGAHYPTDVLAGAVLGSVLGFGGGRLALARARRAPE